ncbi:hypothetical protein GE061_019715 [Apolygus lucorum]|uniref:Uncharacterized protein n=1 Tax=Apolygus lucorum TaxID=248454 RepID=A0A8S9X956_APOLU|nr:hypothetical protein GE061_019715 [Apolygus lucorum]
MPNQDSYQMCYFLEVEDCGIFRAILRDLGSGYVYPPSPPDRLYGYTSSPQDWGDRWMKRRPCGVCKRKSLGLVGRGYRYPASCTSRQRTLSGRGSALTARTLQRSSVKLMKKVVLFVFCVAFEHAAFALHDSAYQSETPFWTAGWSWGGRTSKGLTGLNDEDLVDMLYRREGRAGSTAIDHPTLAQRMEYRRTYEVTEEPERDWEGDAYDTNLDNQQDYSSPDNSIGYESHPASSSSSTFMSSSGGDSLFTAYSHKIIHSNRK